MPAIQRRLFPDPKPLVEEFGAEFFRQLPEGPGVYLMRDLSGAVLYVGKAKSLRRRIQSYRVANPERMPRRTLRLLRAVKQISWEVCTSEPAALRRESELLLQLKPRFNRAGVWRAPPRFLAWRVHGEVMECIVVNHVDGGWFSAGPFGTQVCYLRHALVRLFWCVLQPESGIIGMPAGWFHGCLPACAAIPLAGGRVAAAQTIASRLHDLAEGADADFTACFAAHPNARPAYERSLIEQDLEYLITGLPRRAERDAHSPVLPDTVVGGPPIAGFPDTKLFAFCAGLSAQ